MRKSMILLALMVMLLAVLSPLAANTVSAASNANNYDSTNVLDDLRSATINGNAFNISNYPINSNDSNIYLVTFVEYCFSAYSNKQENYGLYLYLYNPSLHNISYDSNSNKIQLAAQYNNGAATVYSKLQLEYCNRSLDAEYRNLFYKFKIKDVSAVLKRVDGSSERQYDISGIELMLSTGHNPVEYNVSSTYKYTGYAEGYGAVANAPSSLSCEIYKLDTISLTVSHTSFRPGTVSSLGVGHQNQLNSVYFAVPNEYLNNYGGLQRIMAEWYEYKTQPVFVTSDTKYYNDINDYVGVDLSKSSSKPIYTYLSNEYSWQYNTQLWTTQAGVPVINALHYNFYTSDLSKKITSSQLENYIHNYNKSFTKGTLPIKNNNISADLFTSSVDNGRTKGYNLTELDNSNPNDWLNMLSYSSSNSKWNNFWLSLQGYNTTTEYKDIKPILPITSADMSSSNSMIANKLLIDEADVPELKTFYNSVKNNSTVFLFRYAVTDYYSYDVWTKANDIFSLIDKNSCYAAQQTVFLDFDIIQLTFGKEGVYTVIPVVSSPIDVVSAITPPVEPANWFQDTWNSIVNWFNSLMQTVKIVLIVIAVVLALIIILAICGVI